MSNPIPKSVAAIDLGSNSFHMIICNLKGDKIQVVDKLKEMVRLAAGMDNERRLNEETQLKALGCLERFGQRIRNFPSHSVSIVGTNTLRSAKNAHEFIEKAERALGHPIHIISGIEEARLIYQGVAHTLASNSHNRFVMDIGGGSTEYIIGRLNTAHTKESLNMGCVTVSEKFFKKGEISKKSFRKACLFAEQNLEPFTDKFNSREWDEAIGASGSLKAIKNVLELQGWSLNGITLSGMEQLVSTLLQKSNISEVQLQGLSEERRPVFLGAVVIVYTTFKTLNIQQMTISDGALREGLIYDMIERIYDHDIRSKTASLTAERYQADRKHSAQLKETLHLMCHQLSDLPVFKNNPESIHFLEWAADLHEIGIEIAHSQYHKHSAYIIENADLSGFSNQDQRILSRIVRNHRKKLNLIHFADLVSPWKQQAPILTILFRLAFLIHRNRHTQTPDLKVIFREQTISLTFPKKWLSKAPLTEADLILEKDYLAAAGFDLSIDECKSA